MCIQLYIAFWIMSSGIMFINSFILETYMAPLQETTTQRRSQPSHGQKKTSERCKIWKGGPSARNAAHADGPTTEKALPCIITKRARGTKKLNPRSRTQHPT